MRYKKMSETCSEENVSAVVENVLVEEFLLMSIFPKK
jgi:hypothetical protein